MEMTRVVAGRLWSSGSYAAALDLIVPSIKQNTQVCFKKWQGRDPAEVARWCDENLSGEWALVGNRNTIRARFETAHDAVVFKLRWSDDAKGGA